MAIFLHTHKHCASSNVLVRVFFLLKWFYGRQTLERDSVSIEKDREKCKERMRDRILSATKSNR